MQKEFFLSYYKNATKDFHINFFSEPKEALNQHTHNYFQLYYVLQGGIVHYLENSSAVLYCRDVFIIPPNVPHYIRKNEENTKVYSISFTKTFIEKISKHRPIISNFIKLLLETEHEKVHPKLSLNHDDSIFMETLIKRIYNEFNDKSIGSDEIIREAFLLVITLFARNYYFEKPEKISVAFENNKQAVLHCISFLSENFSGDISLDDMVKYAAMSKSSFCNLFKQISGYSFKDFINKKRIEKAENLILSNTHEIKTIASLCGYTEFSTFYRNFKKLTGLSPSEYKSKIK